MKSIKATIIVVVDKNGAYQAIGWSRRNGKKPSVATIETLKDTALDNYFNSDVKQTTEGDLLAVEVEVEVPVPQTAKVKGGKIKSTERRSAVTGDVVK